MEKKEKSRISLLTVFLLIAFIVAIAVVTIGGITKRNSLEENKKSITIQLDGYVTLSTNCYILQNGNLSSTSLNSASDFFAIFSIEVDTSSDYCILIDTGDYYVLDGQEELDVIEYNETCYYCKNITKESEISDYHFTVMNDTKKVQSKISWTDQEEGKATIINKISGFPPREHGEVIFVERLPDNFVLADEYQDSEEWKIIDENELSDRERENLDSANGIPNYIYSHFFAHMNDGYFGWNKKIKYIYLKNTNIVYSLISDEEVIKETKFHVICNDLNKESSLFEFDTRAVYAKVDGMGSSDTQHVVEEYDLGTKYLKYEEQTNTRVIVNKLVNGEIGNNTYHLGVFHNESDTKVDKIYDIHTENGIGHVTIDLDLYDVNENYYIYEVDEFGNKIESERLTYSKNLVLDHIAGIEKLEILSDKGIISSLSNTQITDSLYNNNLILFSNKYEDTVTITSDYQEEVHFVRYITQKGGSLEGQSEEVVKHGEKSSIIPNLIPDKNYEFDKWIIEKNGKQIEVSPNEYVVEEDTTFIALFKKIPTKVIIKYVDEAGNEIADSKIIDGYVGDEYTTKRRTIDGYYAYGEEPDNKDGIMTKEEIVIVYQYKAIMVNTGDINIWMYGAILVISIIVICIVTILLLIKNKS
ncbi:MAG: MucBP domain-containing protein [Clostridia bacterium]|nr:MucBP domain-containing protein [Clostridia bacterium]